MKLTTRLAVIILLVLSLATFWTMLKSGIFSMQDYHTFRLYEFNKCVDDLQLPCRWTPDATFEYGQPTFNFYGQLTYAFGQIFRLVGLQVIDTIKALFIVSLVGSALSMFWLAKQIWKDNLAALISAVAYTFAPYRAVDVYVRGALPEALGFVFFPLVVYLFNDFVETRRVRSVLLFGLSLAGLILTHNLSALMLMFFLVPWMIYRLVSLKAWRLVPNLGVVALLVFGLSAFYILPVVAESQYVSINQTVTGFYNFNNHFVTLKQLLLSRFWGYGASTWGDNDGLSLAVGQVQWIVPLLIGLWLVVTKRWRQLPQFWVLTGFGWLMLWLTHNKSVLVWNLIRPMEYIQFPWRFLGLAVFCFSLAMGSLSLVIGSVRWRALVGALVIASLVALNTSFFFEDLWFKVNDQKLFSGLSYLDQISSSAGDYYPSSARLIPTRPTSKEPIFIEGSGSGQLLSKKSNSASYSVEVRSPRAEVSLPIAFFPGWVAMVDNRPRYIYSKGDFGLITTELERGDHQVKLEFKNTLVRDVGDGLSLVLVVVLIGALVWWWRRKW